MPRMLSCSIAERRGYIVGQLIIITFRMSFHYLEAHIRDSSRVYIQAAGGHLQALLACQPALPGIPQRAALGAALSRLGPDGCASLQVTCMTCNLKQQGVVG